MTRDPNPSAGCARVRGRLARAADGELAPLEAALDRGHLEACAECRRALDEHARLLAAVRAASAPSPVELADVTAAVLERVAAATNGPRAARWGRHAGFVAAAAAGLLLALLSALGVGAPLRAFDPAALDRFVHGLPSWADVVRGLDGLSRWV